MVHVASFYNHKSRGKWFKNALRRWYELDGFIMRREQRHKYINKISTIGESSISDHKPKKIQIRINKKKWRRGEIKKRAPKINFEMLRNDDVAIRYQQKVAEKLRDLDFEETDNTRWNDITEVVTTAAREVCGVQE